VLAGPPKPRRPRSASPKRLLCALASQPTSKFQLSNFTARRHILTAPNTWKMSSQFDFSFEDYLQEDANYSLAGEDFNHDFGQPNASFEDQYYMLERANCVWEYQLRGGQSRCLGF
jgi:hypothetical protein